MPTTPPFQPLAVPSRPRVSGTFLMAAAADLHQAGLLTEPEIEMKLISQPQPPPPKEE